MKKIITFLGLAAIAGLFLGIPAVPTIDANQEIAFESIIDEAGATYGGGKGGGQPSPSPGPDPSPAADPDPGVSAGDPGGEGYRAHEHDVAGNEKFDNFVKKTFSKAKAGLKSVLTFGAE